MTDAPIYWHLLAGIRTNIAVLRGGLFCPVATLSISASHRHVRWVHFWCKR